MTPTVEHALAKFQNAPKERQEKLAQIMLIELDDVRDEYQDFVDQRLEQGLAQSKAGLSRPIREAVQELQAEMNVKYG